MLDQQDILHCLDLASHSLGAIEGNLAGEYPIENRLSVYGSPEHWLIVIDRLVYIPVAVRSQQRVHAGITTWSFCYGSCVRRSRMIRYPSGAYFTKPVRLGLTGDAPSGPTFSAVSPGTPPCVLPAATEMRLRDQVIPIDTGPHSYVERGVFLEDMSRIRPFELLRGLARPHRLALLATDTEIGAALSRDLPPLLLRLDEWCHPGVGQRPSETEAFQMIACALATGHADAYRPSHAPNTHWSNWPQAGSHDTEID